MARNYYIRTFTCDFPFDFGGGGNYGYSENNALESYDEPALGSAETYACRTTPGVFSSTSQELIMIAYNSDRSSPPSKPDVTASSFIVQNGTTNYIYWSNYGLANGNYQCYTDVEWQNRGWTNPITDNATWLNELCSAFNTYVAPSHISNNNNYDVYVFKYKFTDCTNVGDQLNYNFFPIFIRGNDPNYDSKIII